MRQVRCIKCERANKSFYFNDGVGRGEKIQKLLIFTTIFTTIWGERKYKNFIFTIYFFLGGGGGGGWRKEKERDGEN